MLRIFSTMALAIAVLMATLPSVASESGRGEAVYKGTCIACHGDDGAGSLPGVPDLSDGKGALAQKDAVLMKRIIDGFQSPGSPLAMPPRGGDPALTDEDLQAALRYMRESFKGSQ